MPVAAVASRAAKRRPPGWSKDYVLSEIVGKGVGQKLRRLSGPLGIKWRTLYNEIQEWKTVDPEFHDAWWKGMEGVPKSSRNIGLSRTSTSPGTLAEFLRHFRSTGKIVESAKAVGVKPATIKAARTPGNESFVEGFDKEYEAALGEVLAQVQDEVITVALHSEDERTRSWAGLKILEKLNRPEFGRHVEIEVKGEIEHRHVPDERMHRLVEERLGGFLTTGHVDPIVDAEVEVVDDGGS